MSFNQGDIILQQGHALTAGSQVGVDNQHACKQSSHQDEKKKANALRNRRRPARRARGLFLHSLRWRGGAAWKCRSLRLCWISSVESDASWPFLAQAPGDCESLCKIDRHHAFFLVVQGSEPHRPCPEVVLAGGDRSHQWQGGGSLASFHRGAASRVDWLSVLES